MSRDRSNLTIPARRAHPSTGEAPYPADPADAPDCPPTLAFGPHPRRCPPPAVRRRRASTSPTGRPRGTSATAATAPASPSPCGGGAATCGRRRPCSARAWSGCPSAYRLRGIAPSSTFPRACNRSSSPSARCGAPSSLPRPCPGGSPTETRPPRAGSPRRRRMGAIAARTAGLDLPTYLPPRPGSHLGRAHRRVMADITTRLRASCWMRTPHSVSRGAVFSSSARATDRGHQPGHSPWAEDVPTGSAPPGHAIEMVTRDRSSAGTCPS